MKITDAINALPDNSPLKKRLLSPQFQYVQEMLGLRIRHNRTRKQMAHMLRTSEDKYTALEQATDLKATTDDYKQALKVLKKKLQD